MKPYRLTHLSEVVEFLKVNNSEVQSNAAAFLQHNTFQNENNKEIVRSNNGIPLIINLLTSSNIICQFNASGLLRNLTHGPNTQIKKQIENYGGFKVIESLIDINEMCEPRFSENLLAILCNISCSTAFHDSLTKNLLKPVIQNVLLNQLGLESNSVTNTINIFKLSNLHISYTPLLLYITMFLKNLSSGSREIRQEMRECEGLVASIAVIIKSSSSDDKFNSKTVENCICIIQNLCFALREFYESEDHYLTGTKNGNKNNNVNNNSKQNQWLNRMESNIPSKSDNGGLLLIWNSEIIELLIEIIKSCKNWSSVMAAIGTVQNLSAHQSHIAHEFRFSFRKNKGLPVLVLQVINSPDNIVKATILALRNLANDSRNLELIGSHGLPHMLECLPTTGREVVKRNIFSDETENHSEESLSLDTIHSILSLFLFMMKMNENVCELFAARNGVKKCIFLLKSDIFYQQNIHLHNSQRSENVNKIPVVAALILQFLWKKPQLRKLFIKEKFNSEDFCIQSFSGKMKSSIICSNGNGTTIYYGTPYVKARTGTLLPATGKNLRSFAK